MRIAPALLLAVACGAPAFAPVKISMQDDGSGPFFRYFLVAYAEKKANPKCIDNCEFEPAIEDGGCKGVALLNDGGLDCPPGGGDFLPLFGADFPDAGPVQAPERRLAPGATLQLTVRPTGVASCVATYEVPVSGLDIAISRDSNDVCAFTTR